MDPSLQSPEDSPPPSPESEPEPEFDPETLVQDEPDPVELDDAQPEPEPEAASEPETIEAWLEELKLEEVETFESVALDWVPEGMARDRVKTLLAKADARVEETRLTTSVKNDELESQAAALSSQTEALRRLTDTLESGTDLKDVEEYKTTMASNQLFASQVTKMSWQAFDMAYPDWNKAPKEQHAIFGEIIQGNEEKGIAPRLMEMPGETYFDKMEEAWRYAAYTSGSPKPTRGKGSSPTTTATPPAAPQAPAGPTDAQKAAAAIGGDAGPPSTPMRTVHERDMDEIMDEHDHYLEDGRIS